MIKKIIEQSKNKLFLIAYSGGLDSTVLLHKIFTIQKENIPSIQIRAIHINHNINYLSKEWAIHCKKICKKYKIPLIIKDIFIKIKKHNCEEQLRIKRYTIIYQNLCINEILLTGHHLNDQCETLILSLKRGSGPTGLSGMEQTSKFGNKKIIRPFLNIIRQDLELYAQNNKLKWIEDFSNSDILYDRNFIRHKIIPILQERWPYFLKNCARSANICRQETILLRHFLKQEIKQYITSDYGLKIKNFKNINKIKCHSLIRYWISKKTIKMPSYKMIHSIYYQMIYSQKDANPKIVLNQKEIRRFKSVLYLITTQPIIKNIIIFWHDTSKNLILPNALGELKQNPAGLSLPIPKKNELINIRFQYEGTLLIIGRNKKRNIKKIWQEKNIPPWLRNQIPLLFYNDRFISALGVFIVNTNEKNKKIWKITWKNKIPSKNINQFIFV
ncbi:tRNA lysidine(34) synthetase TilS [Buchnera aphidicola]|uniref:tRNA lysidine(34) synthetase TilS n=1 Tax=Buchnera aphidicola TaxID=9 RepID=UPI003463A1FC